MQNSFNKTLSWYLIQGSHYLISWTTFFCPKPIHIHMPCICNWLQKVFQVLGETLGQLILQSFAGAFFWSLMGHVIGLEIKSSDFANCLVISTYLGCLPHCYTLLYPSSHLSFSTHWHAFTNWDWTKCYIREPKVDAFKPSALGKHVCPQFMLNGLFEQLMNN